MEIFLSVATIVISIVSTGVAGFAVAYSKTLKDIDLSHEHYEDIKHWYDETLLILKQLYLEFADTKSQINKKELNSKLAELSTKIDSGRLFFENKKDGVFGENKPETFRGRKPITLDFLTLYYDIFKQDKQQDNLRVLQCVQRAFVSEMTKFLNENKNSKKFIPYKKYDLNDIININNLETESFRKILISDDIVSIITDEIQGDYYAEVLKK